MTRAEPKDRNRRALLEAARQAVARDGHRARLEDITEQARLTTGAVHSLSGSKNGLLTALVEDSRRAFGTWLCAARTSGRDSPRRSWRTRNAWPACSGHTAEEA